MWIRDSLQDNRSLQFSHFNFPKIDCISRASEIPRKGLIPGWANSSNLNESRFQFWFSRKFYSPPNWSIAKLLHPPTVISLRLYIREMSMLDRYSAKLSGEVRGCFGSAGSSAQCGNCHCSRNYITGLIDILETLMTLRNQLVFRYFPFGSLSIMSPPGISWQRCLKSRQRRGWPLSRARGCVNCSSSDVAEVTVRDVC